MQTLEPPAIQEIAEHLAAKRWVDLRIPELGVVQRVQITKIIVEQDKDTIVVRQKWPSDDGSIVTDLHEFDVDYVRRIGATKFDLDSVRPLADRSFLADGRPLPVLRQLHGQTAKNIVDAIVHFCSARRGVSEAEIRQATLARRGVLRTRQFCMWLAYEMTDLSAREICVDHFGYKSRIPMKSTKHWAQKDATFQVKIRAYASALDRDLKCQFRRSSPSDDLILQPNGSQ